MGKDKLPSIESVTPKRCLVHHTLQLVIHFQRTQPLTGYNFEYSINIGNNEHYCLLTLREMVLVHCYNVWYKFQVFFKSFLIFHLNFVVFKMQILHILLGLYLSVSLFSNYLNGIQNCFQFPGVDY